MFRNAIASAARPVLNAVRSIPFPSFSLKLTQSSSQRTATTLSAGFPKVTQRVRC